MNWLVKFIHPTVFLGCLLIGSYFISDGLLIYAKAELAQYLIESAWQQTLSGSNQVKPWPWADTWPVGRLQSSRHNVDLYILDGAQGNTLAFGPGHLQDSAQLASNGSSIVAGHRDTHFTFMQQLQHNDLLKVTNSKGESMDYRVSSIDVVDSRKGLLYVDHHQSQLILVTCYPFHTIMAGGPLRYVATATAVSTITI